MKDLYTKYVEIRERETRKAKLAVPSHGHGQGKLGYKITKEFLRQVLEIGILIREVGEIGIYFLILVPFSPSYYYFRFFFFCFFRDGFVYIMIHTVLVIPGIVHEEIQGLFEN